MSTFNKLKLELMTGEFNKDQLRQLEAIVAGRLGSTTRRDAESSRSREQEISRDLELFYRAIADELWESVSVQLPPIHVLRERTPKTFNLIKSVGEEIVEWLEKQSRDPVNVKKRTWLYWTYAQLVVSHLLDERPDVPVTLRTVLHQHESFPSLFDRAFPGYVGAARVDMLVGGSRASHRVHVQR